MRRTHWLGIGVMSACMTFGMVPESHAAEDYVILKAADKEWKHSEIEALFARQFPNAKQGFGDLPGELQDNILQSIARRELLLQKGREQKLYEDKEVQMAVEEFTDRMVIEKFLQSKSETMISDADIRKAYEKEVAKLDGKEEVRARHILVEEEDKIKEIHRTLTEKDGDFEALAKEHTKDPGTRSSGGDLGFFTKDQMVKEFSEVAFSLKKGEISAPVKSDFGWHVIRLEDRRPIEPPTFEKSEKRIRESLAAEALKGYLSTLLKDESVTFYSPDGSTRSPSPAGG